MNSLIYKILNSKSADDWRYFRLHRDKLTHLVAVLSNQRVQPQIQRVILTNDQRTQILFIAESSTFLSPPFTLQNSYFTIAYIGNGSQKCEPILEGIGQYSKETAVIELSSDSEKQVGIIETFHQFSHFQLKNDLFEILELESLREKEGEDLFTCLGGMIRSVFQADYIEFQPEIPTDFSISRAHGWVWQSSAFSGQLLSILLVPRAIVGVYRRDSLIFIDEPAEAKEIMNVMLLEVMGLKSGFLLPIIHQSKKLGIIKNFYAHKIAMIPSDIEIVEQFRRKFSVLLDWCRLHLRAKKQAIVDGLTNLYNHRFFRDQLKLEFQRAHRYHKKMTLIMVDIDDFKHFNDTYGHLAGDRALTDIANTIKQAVRDIDFVARYGGEEFALILPEVNLKNGLVVAEKIRRAVELRHITVEDGNTLAPLTISCGVTDNESAKGPDDLIERADRALYWVKRHGRNLVRAESVTHQS